MAKRYIRSKKTFVDRIKQFPGESLCLRNSKLFCDACKELLSSKKSILQNHVASKKHDSGKAKIKKKKKTKKRDQTITEALRLDNTQSKDYALPVEERAYCLQMVEEFLKAGIPLRKIDKLRLLLEKQGYRLSHHSNIKE